MEKSLYEQMGGTYHWEGDYRIPGMVASEAPNIGIWGQRHRKFLKEHHRILYNSMLYSGTLNAHLEKVDRTASEIFDRLVKQMAAKQGITEALKFQDQMAWVGAMNNIHNAAEEIIRNQIIYTEHSN